MENGIYYIDTIDRPKFTMGLRSDNIIHITLKDGVEVNQKIQDELVQVFLELRQGCTIKIPAVIKMGEFISIVDDIPMKQLHDISEMILCIIICVENAGHRLLANFYNTKFQPLNEYIIVKDFDQAIAYAKSKLDENDANSKVGN